MRQLVLSTVVIAALATPLTARQPDDQGPQPAPPPAAQSNVQRVTVPFSDPSRPGSVQISIVMGSITIKGSNRKDVVVEARPPADRPPRRRAQPEEPPPGLRRLTQSGSFSVEEDKNEITVDVGRPDREMDFVIDVPMRSNLALETVMGSIFVEGVDGDLEIDSVNGDVTLTNVGGSVVAHSVNGRLLATVTRPTPQKPMAFTSLNGSVDVTLPPAVKANLKLRSDQGDVYTDFDLQLRPDGSSPDTNPRRNGRTRIDVDKAIYGSINGGGPDFEMRTFNGNVYVRKAK
jgi:Putative adhesin